MKVLYFHQYFKTPASPGGIRSYEFAKQLIDRGHSVCMVCAASHRLDLPQIKKGIKRGFIDGIEVIQIDDISVTNEDGIIRRAIGFIGFVLKSIKFALSEDYDLLFTTSTPLTVGIPGIVMKLFRKKKFVFEVRDLWPELPKALGMKNPFLLWGMSLLEWLSYKSADACVGLSPGICEGIRKRIGTKKPIAMIPNASDLELFFPGNRNNLELEGIKPEDTVAVFSGKHGVANGLDAVLDAANELKKMKRDNIVFAFLGKGKLKNHLKKRANEEGLNNCFFYDSIPKNKLVKVLASADIGLMILANVPAFYYGTSPNKFFDYIASGLPVLNNYPGWLADMIEENNLGVVCPPDNPKVFAEKLIALADNKEDRLRMGRNCRKFAEANFSRLKMSNEFVDFLEIINTG